MKNPEKNKLTMRLNFWKGKMAVNPDIKKQALSEIYKLEQELNNLK